MLQQIYPYQLGKVKIVVVNKLANIYVYKVK